MHKDSKVFVLIGKIFMAVVMLILISGCGNEELDNGTTKVSKDVSKEASKEASKDVTSEATEMGLPIDNTESFITLPNDNEPSKQESAILLGKFTGLWLIDRSYTAMNTEEEISPVYVQIDERFVSFFYEGSAYYQSFEYKALEGSKGWIEIETFLDRSGATKKLSLPYELELELNEERLSITIHRNDNIQEWIVSISGKRVDAGHFNTKPYFDSLEKVETNDYIYDTWIWDVSLENKSDVIYMIDPNVTEYRVEPEYIQIGYYDALGMLISSSNENNGAYKGVDDYYLFPEDTSNYYRLKKIDFQTVELYTCYSFPLFTMDVTPDILKNDISVEEEVQHILALNGSESYSKEEIYFFNTYIKGNWKDSNSQDEMEISLILAINTFTTSIQEFFTEGQEPSFYTIEDIDLKEQKVVIKYTDEHRGNEFFAPGVPEDIVMTLKYNKTEDTLVIDDIFRGNSNSTTTDEFWDYAISAKFWR